MRVKIGTTYKVEPGYKKCTVDVEQFDGPNGKSIEVTTVWRWGTFYVTPQNKHEQRILYDAQKNEDGICITNFEQYEMDSTWDGISVDLDFYGDWTEEEKESFRDRYYEDWETMEQEGFQPMDCETYINHSVVLEEVTE